ncbi:MAG: ferrous iron transport protein A [Clostridia bacterium]|nr:ferrous iron transport protein A [Clostridia bacterium]
MEKYLNEFSIGEKGVVKKITAEGKVKRRLFDMGVTPNTDIFMRKVAPLGDPIEVTIRGYELTLRKSEAQCVLMEVKA